MAFQRNAGFTSAIATNPADTAAGYLTPARFNLPDVVSGADVGGIPYCPTATSEATSANLTFEQSAGSKLKIGNALAANFGLTVGGLGSTSVAYLWNNSVTPDATNYSLYSSGADTSLNIGGTNAVLYFCVQNNIKMEMLGTAGAGLRITGGTATTDVAALSITRTNNDAAVATGVKWTFTDTTSAAGFLPFQILGGAAATTNLFKVSKAGKVDAPAYAVGGTDGLASFNGAVTNITVVNGIVTAAS